MERLFQPIWGIITPSGRRTTLPFIQPKPSGSGALFALLKENLHARCKSPNMGIPSSRGFEKSVFEAREADPYTVQRLLRPELLCRLLLPVPSVR